jgi:hypothetical protein
MVRRSLVFAALVVTASSVAVADVIYMVAIGLSRMEIDGSNPQLLFAQFPNAFFEDVAIARATGTVYYAETNTTGGGGLVYRYDPGGSSRIIASAGGVLCVTVDEVAGKVYYGAVPTSEIRRCGLSGESVEVFASGIGYVFSIDIDPMGERIYWSEYDVAAEAGRIVRAGLPFGQNRETIVPDLGLAVDLVVDAVGDKLYWIDQDRGVVQRAALDGTSVETIADTGTTLSSIAIDYDNGKILWIDSASGDVLRANRDGSDRETAFWYYGARRFDIGPMPPVGVEPTSWSRVKTRYGQP